MSTFADPAWDLTPLDHSEVARTVRIHWRNWPDQLTEAGKLVIWHWLNTPTPAQVFERPGSTARDKKAGTTIYARQLALARFFRWLDEQHVDRLADVDEDLLRAYAAFVSNLPIARDGRRDALYAVTLAWAYSPHLPPEHRLPTPPWDSGEDFVGEAQSHGEVHPIHPATMSPLLHWSLRFVDDYSEEILEAIRWRNSIIANIGSTSTGGAKIWADYCNALAESGGSLPGSGRRPGGMSSLYLAGILGIPLNDVRARVVRGTVAIGDPPTFSPSAPLADHGLRGAITITFDEVGEWSARLATACLIVTTYLTGMRPREVLHLRRGACRPTQVDPNGPIRYEVRSTHYKTVVDELGNGIPDGELRGDPWITIAPVARAIAIAEKLSPSELLWTRMIPGKHHRGSVIQPQTANKRISDFIAAVNTLAEQQGTPHELIPDDPLGAVVLRRFRRTLAWFIYRLPGGRAALGIQYGHLRSLTSHGYATRSRDGLHLIMALEEARTIADNLSAGAEQIRQGQAVSGPAAGRFRQAITEFSERYEGRTMSDRQYRALLTNPGLRIYDHADAALICVHDAALARCNPNRAVSPADAETTPYFDRCVGNCANIARTDSNIVTVKERIAQTEADIASGLNPRPIELRLIQRVANLRGIAQQHERDRR